MKAAASQTMYTSEEMANHPGNMYNAFYLIVLLLLLPGCTEEEQTPPTPRQCIDCHAVHTDRNHQQACVSCHKGNNQAESKEAAHVGYVPAPAHPDHLAASCGPCHADIADRIADSVHFTLADSTNLFRRAFGAETDLADFRATPKNISPASALELADDLLRRRCFLCHPYSAGDAYPAVSHGTGCASCHMAFSEGKAVSHNLEKPGDAQCLSCHYGNYVGFDYFGRFEHDLTVEYRTPYTTKNKYFRPYGVEYHQLQADIHHLRGMLCIDCHTGRELMRQGDEKPSCAGCHDGEELMHSLPAGVEKLQDSYILHGRNGTDHPLPPMRHPAHEGQTEKVACQACHAQWTFNDVGKHFLRSDTDEFEVWSHLSVQGSFEIETIIDHNNDFDQTELPAEMTDKLTGEAETGLWHKGFTMRRWENVLLGRDGKGRISPMRPLLDYSLSWIDKDEAVRFDSVPSSAPDRGLRPYVPHTTGPAGLFYQERLAKFLDKERSAAVQSMAAEPINAPD
jgi:hypothetical protein